MSELNAAATLSLEISTGNARTELAALAAEYAALKQTLGGHVAPVNTSAAVQSLNGLAQAAEATRSKVQQSLQQLSNTKFTFNPKVDMAFNPLKHISDEVDKQVTEIKAGLQRQVTELEARVAVLTAQLAKTGETMGKGLKTGMAAGAGSISGTLALDEGQIKAFNERLKQVGLESVKALEAGWTNSNFGKTNQVIASFRKNTEAELQKVIRLSEEAGRMVKEFGRQTALDKYGTFIVDGGALQQAQDRLSQLSQSNANQSLLKQLSEGSKTWQKELENRRKLVETQLSVDATFAQAQAKFAASAAVAANAPVWKQLGEGSKAWKKELEERRKLAETQLSVDAAFAQAQAKFAANAAAAANAPVWKQLGEGSKAWKKELEERRKLAELQLQVDTAFAQAQSKVGEDQVKRAVANSQLIAELNRSREGNLTQLLGNFQHRSYGSRQTLLDKIETASTMDPGKALQTYKQTVVDAIPYLQQLQEEHRKLAQAKAVDTNSTVRLTEAERQQLAAQRVYGNFSTGSGASRERILTKVRAAADMEPSEAVATYGRGIAGLIPKMGELEALHKKLGGTIKTELNPHLADTHALVRGAARAVDELWLSWGRHVPQMVAAFAAVASARKALKEGLEFDYQTKFVEALGSSANQGQLMAGLETQAKNVGRPVNELARALRVLQQTGVDAAQGMSLLPTIVQASVMAETDMKTTTEDLVGVLEVFGLHSKDPRELSDNFRKMGDTMAWVAQETKANLHDVAQSMQGALGVAEQYGVSLQEAATVMAEMGKSGIVGPKAGTYFRAMTERVFTPTSTQAEKLFKILDYKPVEAATGEYRKLKDVLFELFGKINQFDVASQGKLMRQLVPSERGGKAFKDLKNEFDKMVMESGGNIDKLTSLWEAKWSEAGQKSSGLLKTQYEKIAEAAREQLTRLGGQWDTMFAAAGKDASPAIYEMGKALQDALANPGVQQGVSNIATGLASIGKLAAENALLVAGLGTTIAGAFAGRATMGVASWLGIAAGINPLVGTIAGALVGAVTAFNLFGNAAAEAGQKAAREMRQSAESMEKSLEKIRRDFGSMSSMSIRTSADAATDEVIAKNELLKRMRKDAAKDFGINERDITGEFNEYDIANKATSKYGIYPRLDAIKALTKELAAARDKAYELNSLANQRQWQEDRDRPQYTPPMGTKDLDKVLKDAKGTKHSDAAMLKSEKLEQALDKSSIKAMEERQRQEVELLNSKRQNQLMSEEQFRARLTSIYTGYDESVKKLYMESFADLGKIIGSGNKDQVNQALKMYVDLASDYDKFSADKKLRIQKSADEEQGIIKRAWEDTRKFIAEQEAKTEQIKERLRSTHLKLSMSPEDEAAYDARRESAKDFDKRIAAAEEKAQMYRESLLSSKMEERQGPLSNTDIVSVDANEQLREYIKQLEALKDAREAAGDAAARAARQETTYSRSMEAGAAQAFKRYRDEAGNAASMVDRGLTSAFQNAESALSRFVMTGKFSFREFTLSVMRSAAEAMANKAVAQMIGTLGSMAMSYFGGSSASANPTATAAASAPADYDWGTMATAYNAKGNVFSGSSSLHQYANTVQTSPKNFSFTNVEGFAKGGVFAEAGPEAVMPLTRDPQGRLGVRAQLNGGGEPVVNINIVVNEGGGGDDKQSSQGDAQGMWTRVAERVRGVVREELVTQKRPGGMLYS